MVTLSRGVDVRTRYHPHSYIEVLGDGSAIAATTMYPHIKHIPDMNPGGIREA